MKIYLYNCCDMYDYCDMKEYISDSYISERKIFLCKGGIGAEIPIGFMQVPCSSFFSFKKLTKKQIDCLNRELNDLLSVPEL